MASGRTPRRDPHERESSAGPALLTIPRAAREAGVGVHRLRAAVRCGAIPAYQTGAWVRVRWTDVVAWIESLRAPTSSHARRRVAEIMARRPGRRG